MLKATLEALEKIVKYVQRHQKTSSRPFFFFSANVEHISPLANVSVVDFEPVILLFSNSKFNSIDEFFDSLSDIDIGTGLLRLDAVAYLEPCRTSTMDQFCKNNYRPNPLTIFAEKLHGRCLTGFFGGCLERRFIYSILLFGNFMVCICHLVNRK